MAKLEGLDALNRRLAALPVAAEAEMRAALEEGADRVVALSQSLAPVDEGTLRRSIRREDGAHSLQILVKAGGPATTKPVRQGVTAPRVDYAEIREFGTPEHPASPFFFPAWRALRKAVRAQLSRAYRLAATKTRGGAS